MSASAAQSANFVSFEDELNLVGSCIGRADLVAVAAAEARPSDFVDPVLGVIFRVMNEVVNEGGDPRCSVLAERLAGVGEFQERGGEGYLQQDLQGACAPLSPRAARDAGYRLHRLAQRRFLQVQAAKANERANDPRLTVDDVAADLQKLAESLEQGHNAHRGAASLADIASGELAPVLQRLSRGEMLGFSTGFPRLDAETSGFVAGNLTIIAAQTAFGKTSLAGEFALRVARQGNPVVLFSLEMPREIILLRLTCRMARVSVAAVTTNTASPDVWRKLTDALAEVTRLPIFIDDDSSSTGKELRWKIRAAAHEHGARLAIVDYVQIAGGEGKSLYEKVTSISGDLRAAARDIGKISQGHVLALSQVNREGAENGDLQLHNLRESGALEQDAYAVWFLQRPTGGTDGGLDVRELKISKNRNGRAGVRIPLVFLAECTGFEEAK